MNIEFSNKEYRDLLDILHLAEVVMARHRKGDDKRSERHRALIQKLYAYAKREGLEHLIRFDDTERKYSPTHDLEHDTLAHVLIDEFGDHLFWDQLINSLSARDAAQVAGGMERLNQMSETERHHVEGPIRQRYIDEFANNGVANLEVIEKLGSSDLLPLKTSD